MAIKFNKLNVGDTIVDDTGELFEVIGHGKDYAILADLKRKRREMHVKSIKLEEYGRRIVPGENEGIVCYGKGV